MWQVPHPFHLQCGTWESVHVVRSRRFLCTFFCCRQFNLSSPLLIFIYSFPCRLKMARKKKMSWWQTSKAKGYRGGSTHYKQTIGNFKAETMRMCIEEIRRVESMPVPPGTKHPSRNEIAASFGLSPSSVSKHMTGKVLSMGPALGVHEGAEY